MSAQLQMNFTSLPPARKDGMQAALDNANRHVEDWGDLAMIFLRGYCRTNEFVFAEDVTAAAAKWGLIAPVDKRCWGSVYTTAQKEKIIEATTMTRKRANGSHAVIYRSLLWKARA